MKSLDDFRSKCPEEWKNHVNKIFFVLYFFDSKRKGLYGHELERLTGLHSIPFLNALKESRKADSVIILRKEEGDRYCLSNEFRNFIKWTYNLK